MGCRSSLELQTTQEISRQEYKIWLFTEAELKRQCQGVSFGLLGLMFNSASYVNIEYNTGKNI